MSAILLTDATAVTRVTSAQVDDPLSLVARNNDRSEIMTNLLGSGIVRYEKRNNMNPMSPQLNKTFTFV